jgi:predicted O-methyltransferase YrrM
MPGAWLKRTAYFAASLAFTDLVRGRGESGSEGLMSGYEFSEHYFAHLVPIWTALFSASRPRITKVLEIGSYEGGSSVWILENLLKSGGELHCIDTWKGGVEHRKHKMLEVEARFDRNIEKALAKTSRAKIFKHTGESRIKLIELMTSGHLSSFDLVYVDGSHESADVLCDLVGAFQLCKVQGLIICDDYLWGYEDNLRFSPKLAIDSFVNCYNNKIKILVKMPLYQMYFVKTRE